MWEIGSRLSQSRLLMGTAEYPSLGILKKAIQAAKTDIITVSIKRENAKEKGSSSFWDEIRDCGCWILPNTAGCHTASQAVQIAQLSRDIFETHWIKLEVIGENYLLHPNPFELIKAAEILVGMGFEVFPYCTEELTLCQKLYDLGCKILMPWGAPIGSGKGLLNPFHLKILRERLPLATLIVDAGIGSPVHAMQAILMGYDGVLVNSAISKAMDPIKMAKSFRLAVKSARLAYTAGLMPESDFACPSTFLPETLFWSNAHDGTR